MLIRSGFIVFFELISKNKIIIKNTNTKHSEIKNPRFVLDISYTSNTFEKNL